MYCQVCFEEFYCRIFSYGAQETFGPVFCTLRNTGYYDGFSPNDSKKKPSKVQTVLYKREKDNSKRKTKFTDRITEKKLKMLNTPD